MSSPFSPENPPDASTGGELGRRLSTAVVLFHSAVAGRLGLSVTDFKSLDLLSLKGPLTAGELAELTGLSTGATTELIDRLEKAGFVRRERDQKDRRRVIIRQAAERAGEINPYFAGLGQKMYALLENYETQELSAILDFVNQVITILSEEAAALREATRASRSSG